MPYLGSGSIVRLSISAFRAEDPGSNPGRSTIYILGAYSLPNTKRFLVPYYYNRDKT
jgi:hypothetical protein